MNDLQRDLYDVCQGHGLIGLDIGAIINQDDIANIQDAIRDGLNMKGWREPLSIIVTLEDIWRYVENDVMIEDDTGCAIITVKHGLMTAKTVLQWVHVSGSIAVDTDGDGK